VRCCTSLREDEEGDEDEEDGDEDEEDGGYRWEPLLQVE
jgi:hypothetical protein